MSEVLFNIVFKGKHVSSIDLKKAILHFSKLFKVAPEKAVIFFDGKPRVLKKSLTLEKASHMRSVLKKAGLRVSLVKQHTEKITNQEKPEKPSLTMSEAGAVIVNKAFVPPKHFDTSSMNLDEAGVEIVHKEKIPEPQFDLHQLHMDDVGVQIVPEKHIPEAHFDLSGISMEQVGATFAEKQHVNEPLIDISDLSMDDVGSVIVEKKKIPEPDINTDKIKLEE